MNSGSRQQRGGSPFRPPMTRDGGLHSQARLRSAHGAHHYAPKQRKHSLGILLACTIFLATSLLLSTHYFSVPSNDFRSEDINAFLAELDEQIRDAGADAPQMQLRLLRVAAGVEPEQFDRATRVFSELLSSIKSLGHALPCMTADHAVVQGPQNSTGCANGCFFGANLYNSAEVLPNMILQLLAVLGSLGGGQHAPRCFVSVYESGSTDATPTLLDVLRQTLDLLGVPNRIVTGGDINRQQHQQQLRRAGGRRWLWWGPDSHVIGGDDRIRFLADLRNEVLEPLVQPPPPPKTTTATTTGGIGADDGAGSDAGSDAARSQPQMQMQMDRVIFINDVFFCATDVRRLLRYDSADVVCGMDFVPAALWLLNQMERQQLMEDHLAGGLGVPRSWAQGLSRSWLPYRIWKKLYGKSRAFWPWSFPVFYDMWVARDVSGARIRNRVPYSSEPWTADRLAQGLPTPVYSCWNGLVNLRAEPFLRAAAAAAAEAVTHGSAATVAVDDAASSDDDNGIVAGDANDGSGGGGDDGGSGDDGEDGEDGDGDGDYARGRRQLKQHAAAAATDSGPRQPLPLRFRAHRPGECAASECSLLCDDLHAAGYHRVLLEPNVRVAYDWSVAMALYDNFDKTAPEGAPGLRFRPMAQGDARQVEVNWDDDWLPRVEAGARSVECCGIQPGKQTADFDHGCAPRDMTGSWGSGEPAEEEEEEVVALRRRRRR
ncbi:hypothetical protein PLESTB_000312100 [Pleodorina starrii]|uniref:Uncharacterized protein n=1 Tax=Pleodorina starrii TaxID=330485 RepID=A0A9W6BD02_9CHLO|nr:hypothetical protein PLESTM_001722100 [Pleodorina starrii]GLC49819.1 hypothetical protein PLESTB_000312100 [Pleodorina starrii]GLC76223.1 hypothetical protein PLESTF_001752500 [Pleodorina starrii]